MDERAKGEIDGKHLLKCLDCEKEFTGFIRHLEEHLKSIEHAKVMEKAGNEAAASALGGDVVE